MTADPNAPAVDWEDQAPKLLLDTNVYLDLADGLLAAEENRLEAVAAHRDPPLLWACEITFDELVVRLCEGDQADFLRYRAALRWMDNLCGVFGMAEPQKWALRRAVFADAVPDDGELARALNQVRRSIVRAPSYGEVSQDIRDVIDKLRTDYKERIDRWVDWRTQLGAAARQKVEPGQPGIKDTVLVANVLLEISRKYAAEESAVWGPLRDPEDQKRAQREMIAFEVSLLRKAQNRSGYNHAKWRGDHNDYWLLAYPAAGYTIVTREKRLPDALKQAECHDARVVSVEDGIAMAEGWLARR